MKAKDKLVAEIIRAQGSKIISVRFIKRTTGKQRVMKCRLNVKKYTKGGKLTFKPSDYKLLSVYDLDYAQKVDPKKAYRFVDLTEVIDVICDGKILYSKGKSHG